METANSIVNLLQNNELDKAFEKFKSLIENGYLLDNQLIPSAEKEKRINSCLCVFTKFVVKLKTGDFSKFNEEIFDLLTKFIQRPDVEKEEHFLDQIVSLYQHLALLELKLEKFESSLKNIAIAIGFSNENKIWKQYLAIKSKANLPLERVSLLSRTVVELLEELHVNFKNDAYDILCHEFSLYKQQNSYEWAFVVVKQILQREIDPLRRANGFLLLAKVLFADKTLSSDSALDSCEMAIKLLSSVKKSSFLKWKILCDVKIWKHLCLMQQKRNVMFEHSISSVASDKDLFETVNDKTKSFDFPPSKIFCTLPDFEPINVLIEEAFEIWDVHLRDEYDTLENVNEKRECLEIYSTLSRLALLIPKPLLSLKALIWLFTKRGSFLDWIHLVGLLYETDGQRLITFLNQISISTFESWELCAQSIFRFASHCVSNEVEKAFETFNECEATMNSFNAESTTSFRLISMWKYFTTFFLRLTYEHIPEHFKTPHTSMIALLMESYRRSFGILKSSIGQDTDFSKTFCSRSELSVFDVVWCLRRIYDLATIYDQCGLPREAFFYFSEGFDLARRLGYPYWTLIFLNGYLKIQWLCDEKDACSEYFEAAENFFGLSLCNENSTAVRKRKKKDFKSVSETVNLSTKLAERTRRDGLQNGELHLERIQETERFDFNEKFQNFPHHDVRCGCFVCSDFLIFSSKNYFLDLISRFKFGKMEDSNEDLNMLNFDKYLKTVRNSIDSICQITSIGEKLQTLNILSIFTPFLCDNWFWRTKDLMTSKNYSQALSLIDKVLNRLASDSSSLTNFYSLSFKFFRSKLDLNRNDISKEITDNLSSLKINEKTTKGKTKNSTVKQSKSKIVITSDSQAMDEVCRNLKDYGHLLFYPWYREANEFVAVQNFDKKSSSICAVYLSECFGISLRHHAALIEYKKLTSSPSVPSSNRLKRFDNFKQFYSKIAQFPKDLTLVTLYLTVDCDLILTRLSSRCEPLVVNLGRVVEKFDASAKMKEFYVENKLSVHIREKSEYWTKRFDVDARLKIMIETIENLWFGFYKPLLLGYKNDENVINENPSVPNSVFEVLVNASTYLSEKDFESLCRELLPSKNSSTAVFKKLYFKNMFNANVPLSPVVLVLDKNLHVLPFESMPILNNQPISRSISLHAIVDLLDNWRLHQTIKKSNVYYILNPSQDLLYTQSFFEDSFSKSRGWSGCVGKEPSSSELQNAIENKDLIIYCGHGNGYNHGVGGGDSKKSTCAAAVLLMGCASGKYETKGSVYEPFGVISTYQIMRCPSVVACLWDVTDRDIDCYLEYLLCVWLRYKNGKPNEKCLRGKISTSIPDVLSLPEAVAQARQFCKLRYLTGSASVVYGLPVTALR